MRPGCAVRFRLLASLYHYGVRTLVGVGATSWPIARSGTPLGLRAYPRLLGLSLASSAVVTALRVVTDAVSL